jgi:Rps23 Pro-64 3,4-dihydroxylase Tpa1-like proline 4-hydroxylase
MWLNEAQVYSKAISKYKETLLNSHPNHVVIDDLFNDSKLHEVLKVLQHPMSWQTQKHTYDSLYASEEQWQKAKRDQRFVQRDIWQRDTCNSNIADEFLAFLRGEEFMSLLSQIFNVALTDINVAKPTLNSNFFRLGPADFVEQHADDTPGREVCMLLYLNKDWGNNEDGKLVFAGKDNKLVRIAPLYNRCVLFDPSSQGAEHWVERLNAEHTEQYRYNVTSWYWSE